MAGSAAIVARPPVHKGPLCCFAVSLSKGQSVHASNELAAEFHGVVAVVERPDPEGRSYDPSRVFFHRPGSSSVISPSSNCFRSRSPRSSSSASATSALLSSKPHGRQRLIFRFETTKQQFTAAETAKPKAPSKLGKAEKRVMTRPN